MLCVNDISHILYQTVIMPDQACCYGIMALWQATYQG